MFKFEITALTKDIKSHIAVCINNDIDFNKIRVTQDITKIEIPCNLLELNKLITDYTKLFDTTTIARARIKCMTLDIKPDAVRRITHTPRYFEFIVEVEDDKTIEPSYLFKKEFTQNRYDGLIYKTRLRDSTLSEFNKKITEFTNEIIGLKEIVPYIVIYDSE